MCSTQGNDQHAPNGVGNTQQSQVPPPAAHVSSRPCPGRLPYTYSWPADFQRPLGHPPLPTPQQPTVYSRPERGETTNARLPQTCPHRFVVSNNDFKQRIFHVGY